MIEDEVVREVRAVREAFAASHGYDIRAMVAALHEFGVASGRELVRLAPRKPTMAGSESPAGPTAQQPTPSLPGSGLDSVSKGGPTR